MSKHPTRNLELGFEDLAKYPFLDETLEYIRSVGFEIDELLKPEYADVVERAKNRILPAIKKGELDDSFSDARIEILSFPIALMLVRATGMNHVMSKYALAESIRIEKFLLQEKSDIIPIVFEKVIGVIPIEEKSDSTTRVSYKIPLEEYVKRIKSFHTPNWRLVNREIDNGLVLLSTNELIRILREEIYALFLNQLRSEIPLINKPELKPIIDEIKSSAPLPQYRNIVFSEDNYPPCVSKALEMLNSGENVPHYGRFLMTTFLINIGKNSEDVIDIYKTAPDFKESITRYQVEHIAGLKGSRIKYSVPGCNTVNTNKFCYRTPDCGSIKNPLSFKGKKQTKLK